MQLVRCIIHKDEFTLPIKNEEYNSGKYHDNVEALCKHREIHGDCKFEEIAK